MGSSLSIRPVEAGDIAALERHVRRGHPDAHRDRQQKQTEGKGLYATAWQGGTPTGILFVDWEGSSAQAVRTSFPDCPHLIDLFVLRAYRRKGIAAQLLAYAETEARRQGYEVIGLDVDLNDPGCGIAHGIYTRWGYRDAGIEHMDSYTAVDEDGKEMVIEERLRFMVKELGSDGT